MKHQYKPLALLCLMFLTVGAMFTMNDVLLPTVMEYFTLNYVQATLIQVAFYITYIIFPVPISWIIEKYGYKISLVLSLAISATGCMLFIPSQFLNSYAVLLGAIFTLSTGITIINVAANPFTTLLGDPEGAHIRINFVQSFSRIGYAITPVIAAPLIYSASGKIDYYLPYCIIGGLIFLVGVLMYTSKIPEMKMENFDRPSLSVIIRKGRAYPHLMWGVVAMFFYVGAEATTAGFFIPYLTQTQGIPMKTAVNYLSLYYVFAAVMGLVASLWILKYIRANILVGLLASLMIVTYLVCIYQNTPYNHYLLAGLGLGLSVMFPTLFSLAIEKTGEFAAQGSALLNFALVGGAAFTPIQGYLADLYNVAFSYWVPCICFIVVAMYAFFFTYQSSEIPTSGDLELNQTNETL